MATLTEFVASLVVQSSVAALSHFGATLEAPRAEPASPPVVEGKAVVRSKDGTSQASAAKPDGARAPSAAVSARSVERRA